MNRILSIVTAVLVTSVLLPAMAGAQGGGTVRVTRSTPVMETPRGDSVVIGTVPSGVVLEVLESTAGWYRVAAPTEDPSEFKWRRGWIRASFVEVVTPGVATTKAVPAPPPSTPRDPLLIRGFGQAGGTLFTARDSFETILDSALGGVFGGGAQVSFGNGLFAQVGVDRFRKTGSRALVSGEQIFRLGIPHTITVTPIHVTVGYRDTRARRTVGYGGGGFGSHALKEASPDLGGTEDLSATKIGYHLVGGAEFRMTGWVWLAGEIQWSAVPNAIGDRGISAVFEEDDLGGTTFRFKVLFGR